MNAFKTFLFAATLVVSSAANGADWPLYFDAIIKDRYVLVVLHEGGRAQYFDRMIQTDAKGRPTNDVYIVHDDNATWGSFPEEAKNKGVIPESPKDGKPIIYVRTNQFRFDYYYEEGLLTEFDKMGIQYVLKKRKNTNQTPIKEEQPNKP